MEQNSLYQNVKKKLEGRKIVPSDTAWTALESQLQSRNYPKKSNAMLYRIAVSVALLLAGSVYFLTWTSNPTTTPVVKHNSTPENTVPEEKTLIFDTIPAIPEEAVAAYPVIKKHPEKTVRTTPSFQDKTQRRQQVEDQRIDKAVAEKQKLQDNDFLNAETNALLLKAQKALLLQQITNDTLNRVDAMALLEAVEDELDQSFKDKVFEALKENFYKMKTALAERNN